MSPITKRVTTAAAPKETLANAAAMAALVVPLMTIVYPVETVRATSRQT